jgi:hypothetical protein
MNLRMSVTPPSEQLHRTPEFDLSVDYESLIMDACELLSEAGCEFHVEGFGQRAWPVDVSYDLSTVMEQLPIAMAALQHGGSAVIDFYGQGVERGLTFETVGDLVTVHCASRTDWTPEPETEQVSQREAAALLEGLAGDFKVALERTCPALALMEPFKHW